MDNFENIGTLIGGLVGFILTLPLIIFELVLTIFSLAWGCGVFALMGLVALACLMALIGG